MLQRLLAVASSVLQQEREQVRQLQVRLLVRASAAHGGPNGQGKAGLQLEDVFEVYIFSARGLSNGMDGPRYFLPFVDVESKLDGGFDLDGLA